MTQILLMEDDRKMALEIKLFLANQGFTCEVAGDSALFLARAAAASFQLYLLDINVPGINGMEVCKHIRSTNTTTPILMLTAYGAVADKVQALESGADDYLVKPFHLDELLARVKALLRRSNYPDKEAPTLITLADLVINTTEMKVNRAGKEINLTLKEYKLLELLAQARGKILSKQIIAEQVWDIHFETGTNTIEVYINFLRNKIDKGFDPPLIHTRPGFGYYLKETK